MVEYGKDWIHKRLRKVLSLLCLMSLLLSEGILPAGAAAAPIPETPASSSSLSKVTSSFLQKMILEGKAKFVCLKEVCSNSLCVKEECAQTLCAKEECAKTLCAKEECAKSLCAKVECAKDICAGVECIKKDLYEEEHGVIHPEPPTIKPPDERIPESPTPEPQIPSRVYTPPQVPTPGYIPPQVPSRYIPPQVPGRYIPPQVPTPGYIPPQVPTPGYIPPGGRGNIPPQTPSGGGGGVTGGGGGITGGGGGITGGGGGAGGRTVTPPRPVGPIFGPQAGRTPVTSGIAAGGVARAPGARGTTGAAGVTGATGTSGTKATAQTTSPLTTAVPTVRPSVPSVVRLPTKAQTSKEAQEAIDKTMKELAKTNGQFDLAKSKETMTKPDVPTVVKPSPHGVISTSSPFDLPKPPEGHTKSDKQIKKHLKEKPPIEEPDEVIAEDLSIKDAKQ